MDLASVLSIVAVILAGMSACLLTGTVLGLAPGRRGDGPIDFATEQVLRLEAIDPTHRLAGRLVDEVTPLVRRAVGASSLDRVTHDLATCGLSPPWSADRYVAAAWCRAAAFGMAAAAVVAAAGGGVAALPLGAAVAAVAVSVDVAALHRRAEDRAREVGSSLAFAADLMTLVLRAGGTPGEAFQAVARECAGTPIGEEFARVIHDVDRGTPRAKALNAFSSRFPDTAVRDFVFALVKGEETGTPIAAILTSQAAELRRKQSQACERQAAEAGVKMSFPNMLVMVACMIVIVGPFILPVIYR